MPALDHNNDQSDDHADPDDDIVAMVADDTDSVAPLPQALTEQGEDSWGLGSCEDDLFATKRGFAAGKVNDPLSAVKAHVVQFRHHVLPFDTDEKAAIELLDLLMRKKAPLGTYDATMKWHIDNMPDSKPNPSYVSRHHDEQAAAAAQSGLHAGR